MQVCRSSDFYGESKPIRIKPVTQGLFSALNAQNYMNVGDRRGGEVRGSRKGLQGWTPGKKDAMASCNVKGRVHHEDFSKTLIYLLADFFLQRFREVPDLIQQVWKDRHSNNATLVMNETC